MRKSFAAAVAGGVGRHVAAFPGRRAWRLIERDSRPAPRAPAKSICGDAVAATDAPHRGDGATRSFAAML
jgi:hypothetical protein